MLTYCVADKVPIAGTRVFVRFGPIYSVKYFFQSDPLNLYVMELIKQHIGIKKKHIYSSHCYLYKDSVFGTLKI